MKFITETWHRLWMKSPSYFEVIKKISLAITALSGLPLLLQQLQSQTGVVIPEFMTNFANKTFLFCSVVAFLISKLAVKNPDATKINDDGNVVPKLPFTAKEVNN